MRYLLDTNVCIYVMKNAYPALTQRLLSLRPDEVAISAVTVFELEYGAAKSQWGAQTRERLSMFLAPFHVLPFDARDARAAGLIRAQLAALGRPIGPYDVQIAAQGLSRDLTVVTHNVSEFSRVPGLVVEDWVQ